MSIGSFDDYKRSPISIFTALDADIYPDFVDTIGYFYGSLIRNAPDRSEYFFLKLIDGYELIEEYTNYLENTDEKDLQPSEMEGIYYEETVRFITEFQEVLLVLDKILTAIKNILFLNKRIYNSKTEPLSIIKFKSLLKTLGEMLQLYDDHNRLADSILIPKELLSRFISKLMFNVKHFHHAFDISLNDETITNKLIDEINWRISMKHGKNENDIEVLKSKLNDGKNLISININKINNPSLVNDIKDCIKLSFSQLGLDDLEFQQFNESGDFFKIRELFDSKNYYGNYSEKAVNLFDKAIFDNKSYVKELFDLANENSHPNSYYLKLLYLFAKDEDSFKQLKDLIKEDRVGNNVVLNLMLSAENFMDCKEKIDNFKKELMVSSTLEGNKKIPEEGYLQKKITSFAHGYSIDTALSKDFTHQVEILIQGKIISLSATDCKELLPLITNYNNGKLSKQEEKELLGYVSITPHELNKINDDLLKKYSTIRENDKYKDYVSSRFCKASEGINYLPKKFNSSIIQYLDNIIKESSKKDNKPDTKK